MGILEDIRETIRIEREALDFVSARLDQRAVDAVGQRLLQRTQQRPGNRHLPVGGEGEVILAVYGDDKTLPIGCQSL